MGSYLKVCVVICLLKAYLRFLLPLVFSGAKIGGLGNTKQTYLT